jgi:CRISPR/Cas system-associated endoribonuclease Cas2
MNVQASTERVYVLSYDIADDGRRNRLSRFLESRGQRVQWSVFEVIATEAEVLDLLSTATESPEIFDAEKTACAATRCARGAAARWTFAGTGAR